MKYLIIFFCSFTISAVSLAQTDSSHPIKNQAAADTLPAYKRISTLPIFSIQLPDGNWYSRGNMREKKPVLILYFSPDCGHCILETEDMISKMNQLKNLQIVMVTSKPFDEMKNFSDHYKLHRFPNIKIGWDAQRSVTRFFNVQFTPFSALYNERGKFVKAYENGIDWEELFELIK